VDLLTVQWGLENLLSDLDTHMLDLFGLFDFGGGGFEMFDFKGAGIWV
jgi:hypothetical protein